jgi:acetyltransferase-like isoleucine patch superfamily enzyme
LAVSLRTQSGGVLSVQEAGPTTSSQEGSSTAACARQVFAADRPAPSSRPVRVAAIIRDLLLELAAGIGSALFRFVVDRVLFFDGPLFMKVRGRLYTLVYGWGHGVSVDRFVTLREPRSIRIGRYTRIDRHAILGGPMEAGEYCWIGERDMIYPHTLIGDRVSIAPNVMIITQWHLIGPPEKRTDRIERRPVRIGSGCTINAGAMILAGCHVGEGCVIMSGARVTRSLPPHSIAAGDPARVVRRLQS